MSESDVRPAACSPPLPARERQLFLEQFEKDLSFFKLFFLLANKSSIIRHMCILWAEDGPAAELGLRAVLGTREANRDPCSPCLNCDEELDPEFCAIVSDFGRHESESCAISDRAAARRCRQTRQTQIYECHAGLIDVAVPLISGDEYIGTLLWGQVLREAPSPEKFTQIRKRLSALSYIDFARLKRAYCKVPVVGKEELRNEVRVVEAFAEYVATSWTRLAEVVRAQHRSIREAQLLRKEFAHVVLDRTGNRVLLRELLEKLGFTRAPNRVLVVKLDSEEEYSGRGASFDVSFTAALHAVEEIAEMEDNVAAAHINSRGLCVFLHDPRVSSAPLHAHALARRLLRAIQERTDLRVRVGIGGAVDEVGSLVDSYDQAFMALAQCADAVAAYSVPVASSPDLFSRTEEICTLMSARLLREALAAVRSLPMQANTRLGDGEDSLARQQRFLCSSLYSICFTAKQVGVEPEVVDEMLGRVDAEMRRPASLYGLHDFYLRTAEMILDEVRKLYRGRREKIAERSRRMIDEHIEQRHAAGPISPSMVAGKLGVSVSTLERTFKRVTGCTFERFVMTQRVEFAKKLLLDPAYNVSEVAERCGFSEPAYFARVFRKIAGCTPTQYMRAPLSYGSGPETAERSTPLDHASAPSVPR